MVRWDTFGAVVCLFMASCITSSDTLGTPAAVEPKQNANITLPIYQSNDCRLVPTNVEEAFEQIDVVLSSDAKLVKYHIHITGSDVLDTKGTNLYRPLYWVKTLTRQGRGLILLRENFEAYSFGTLAVGVESLHMSLRQDPDNCLRGLSVLDTEQLLRRTVLNDFRNNSDVTSFEHLKENQRMCNQHVVDVNGDTNLEYFCCGLDSQEHFVCAYETSSIWLETLFTIIIVLKVLFVLYAPSFLPKHLYSTKNLFDRIVYNLPETRRIKITRASHDIHVNDQCIRASRKRFMHMKTFNQILDGLPMDKTCTVDLKKLHFKAKRGHLLHSGFAPVGPISAFLESVVHCNVRRSPNFSQCCYAPVFPCIHQNVKNVQWFKVLKSIMRVFLICIFVFPWAARLYMYYMFENEDLKAQTKAAEERTLPLQFEGSVTRFLTPTHPLFISIYVLLGLDLLIYMALSAFRKTYTHTFIHMIKKSVRNAKNDKFSEFMGITAVAFSYPCIKLGFLGLLLALVVGIIVFPIWLVLLAFHTFPTFNLTVRLFGNTLVTMCPPVVFRGFESVLAQSRIFKYTMGIKKEIQSHQANTNLTGTYYDEDTGRNPGTTRCIRLNLFLAFMIILLTVSLWGIVFLFTEFMSFVVEVCVYTFSGLIMNSDTLTTYVSLVVLVLLYGYQCFNSVKNKFLAFNNALLATFKKLAEDKINPKLFDQTAGRENITMDVKSEFSQSESADFKLLFKQNTYPKWLFSRLAFIFKRNNQAYIPRKFYFEACKAIENGPGSLLQEYMKAVAEFLVILIFLFIVVVVVLAFGENYHLSMANQVIATVAGGVVPYLLSTFVFRTHDAPDWSGAADDTSFHAALDKVVDGYRQSWHVDDMITTKGTCTEMESEFGDGIMTSSGDTSFGYVPITNQDSSVEGKAVQVGPEGMAEKDVFHLVVIDSPSFDISQPQIPLIQINTIPLDV